MQNENKRNKGTYEELTGFKRAIPIILTAFAVFIAFCFILQDTGALGRVISNVLLGLFSIGGYFIPAFLVIHAVFYASDVAKKRTLSRVIFTAITVVTIAALTHSITYWDEGIAFSAKEFYKNGTHSVGGGFIGGVVAFALTKVFGNVGLIIIAIALFALYITYYLSGAKTLVSKILLKFFNFLSGFFSSAGEKHKTIREEKTKKREERIREMRAAEQDVLIDDEFFEADNGLKELTINDLGISEVRDDAEIERNPHLQEKVYKNTDSEKRRYERHEWTGIATEPTEQKSENRRRVNMDYSTVNSSHTLSNSTADSVYVPKNNDIIYDEPIIPNSNTSADEVFSRDFEPFDFKLNEELSNKPSSKAMKEKREPEGISEITEPITELTYEEVEKARQRADFEMKKRAAIEAQRRYAAAEAEANRIKEENLLREEASASIQNQPPQSPTQNQYTPASNQEQYNPAPSQSQYNPAPSQSQYNPAPSQSQYNPAPSQSQYNPAPSQNQYNPTPSQSQYNPAPSQSQYNPTPNYNQYAPANTQAYTENSARHSEPYIPDYMQRNTANEQTASPVGNELNKENEEFERRAETFASAMHDYEKELQESEFKPYSSPTISENQNPTVEIPAEELKVSRTMLEPTPSPSEVIKELDSSGNGSDYVFDTTDTVEFDSYKDTPEDATVFEFTSGDDENDLLDSPDAEDVEIPPEEQNPDVLEQRKLFSFLNDNDSGDEISDSDNADEVFEEFDSMNVIQEDYSEQENKDANEPPFEVAPQKSTFAERMLSKTPPPPPPQPKKVEEKPDYSDYQYPSVELLAKGKIEEDFNQEEEKNQNAEKLVDALLQFNVRISIKGIDRGPRITRYEIVPARGVKVNSVTNLFNDIALNLGVEGMRMEAPIPGKSAIGVEIPNKKPSTVLLRDLVESDEFICASSKTMSCLGKDVTGNPVFADIAKMPHVLVAGATGMGKSVCINSILISILYKARPDEVKFIMIDPKKVEFNGYNGIPHLLIPVVTDVKQAAGALMWAVEQMEKRYDLMEALEVRKLDSYNEKVREHPELGEPLPKIIIVIDELNDIMLQVRKPAEDLIMSIAQKARAAGIHLIIGTQRPSVDVITGVIKANIPSRISCKVASYNDSKTILEQAGAEKLLNNGDMLYIPAGAPKALRVQGAFVSDGEVTAIMKFLKSQAKGSVYDAQALEEINRAAQKCSKGKGDDFDGDSTDDGENLGVLNDQQFLDAVDLAIKSGKISTSLIQRRISVGYGKAAKFIDIMEDMGIVSEPNGQKPRDILITKDEWHEMLSRRSLD